MNTDRRKFLFYAYIQDSSGKIFQVFLWLSIIGNLRKKRKFKSYNVKGNRAISIRDLFFYKRDLEALVMDMKIVYI